MSDFNIKIGRIIEITNAQIKVAIDEKIDTSYKIIDGNPIRIGGVGNFIKVGIDIYEIINEKVALESEKAGSINRVYSTKYLICNIIGYLKGNSFYHGSSGETPNIFEGAYTVTDNELNCIYSGTMTKDILSIGRYVYQQNLEFYLNINKFFASHILIVGNTGSGKSNTLNTLYTQLLKKRDTSKSLFLIIDSNGEYNKAFSKQKTVKNLNTYNGQNNEITIPMELLSSEDWKLLLEATDKTQYPIIKKLWNNIIKELFESELESKSISRFILNYLKNCLCGIINSNNTPSNKLSAINSIREDVSYLKGDFYKELDLLMQYFDCVTVNNSRLNFVGDIYEDRSAEIVNNVNNYRILFAEKSELDIYDFGFLLNLEHIYRTYRYNTNENNTSPMIARFNSNKRDLAKIFLPFTKGVKKDIKTSLFGNSNILVCNVSKSKKDIRRIIVTFICSKLYSEYSDKKENKCSLHLIVDEAHNYLSGQNVDKEDAIAKTCIETFENIIKEGRKFGVFLTMSTQRPSDITSTLMSQAHNYIIHKLVNPNDINVIKNAVPFIDEMSMQMLKVLGSGQAIFSGTAFNRPNIVRVDFNKGETEVNSETIRLTDYWSEKIVDAKGIIDEAAMEKDVTNKY